MRKIFKKIVTVVAAAAMMVGTIAGMPTTEAKAAENVKLYVNVAGPTDYGVNVWGSNGVTATGGPDVECWTGQNKPSLLEGSGDYAGWGYITVSNSADLGGVQFVKGSDVLSGGNVWNATIASLNLTEAFYDQATSKWYKDKALTQEVVAPTLDDIYYVAGAEALVGAKWAATDAKGLMTADGENFSIIFTGIAKGSYEFKVLQDPADFGWDNSYVTEVKAKNGNGLVTVATDNSKVTISINKTTKKVTATVVAPTGEVQEPETTTAAETVASHNVTVKVKLDSSINWDTVCLYAWEGANNNTWPGVTMTKDGDYYTATLEKVEVAAMNMIVNNGKDGGSQTIDLENISVKGDTVEITLSGEKDADGKYLATSSQQVVDKTPSTGDTTPSTGDTTPVIPVVAAIALLGLAVVIMNTKKANR